MLYPGTVGFWDSFLEATGPQFFQLHHAPACKEAAEHPCPMPWPAVTPYPDLDFWVLQIDVSLCQQVVVGGWLEQEAPHLDEVRLCQTVSILLIEDMKGDALLCRGQGG